MCAKCGKSARWVRCGECWKRIYGGLLRHSEGKHGETARLDPRNTTPVLDPTVDLMMPVLGTTRYKQFISALMGIEQIRDVCALGTLLQWV